MQKKQIGIIDSGVGGLSVYQAIQKVLPSFSLLYLADSLYVPYGTKSSEFIAKRAEELVTWMINRQINTIVIACNTITVTCLTRLRKTFPEIAFIGTVPAIKSAIEVTTNHKIGILSTGRTAKSKYVQTLISEFAASATVVSLGTDELVPLVEKGEITGKKVERRVEQVCQPFITAQCDTLVLGCTHFPFLRSIFTHILGHTVTILDSAEAIARQVALRVASDESDEPPLSSFFTTGDKNTFQQVTETLLAESLPHDAVSQAHI